MMLRNKKLKSIQKLRRLHLLRSRKRSGAVTEKSKEQEEEMDASLFLFFGDLGNLAYFFVSLH